MKERSERGALGSIYDRTFRALHGLPDVTSTKPSPIRTVHPVLEIAQTFIIQTVRHKERGDWIFMEYIGTEGSIRVALPPEVADCIARQRDALTTKNRKRAAKVEAARRKAQGIRPGFLKVRKAEGGA